MLEIKQEIRSLSFECSQDDVVVKGNAKIDEKKNLIGIDGGTVMDNNSTYLGGFNTYSDASALKVNVNNVTADYISKVSTAINATISEIQDYIDTL